MFEIKIDSNNDVNEAIAMLVRDPHDGEIIFLETCDDYVIGRSEKRQDPFLYSDYDDFRNWKDFLRYYDYVVLKIFSKRSEYKITLEE